jgi:signal transduction histidine kinase
VASPFFILGTLGILGTCHRRTFYYLHQLDKELSSKLGGFGIISSTEEKKRGPAPALHAIELETEKIETYPEPSLPVAPMDASKIKQVILNLLSNAIQASPKGEKIGARTSVRGNAVVLEVVDSGSGIKEENRERIFQPFFTLKKGGTGLGLAIVKKILEVHGGKIIFYANQSRGVTFRVSLPLRTSSQ